MIVFQYCLLSEFWLRKKLPLVPIIAVTFILIGATSLKGCDKGPCITWKVLPVLLFSCNELYASIYGSYFVIKVCLLFFFVFVSFWPFTSKSHVPMGKKRMRGSWKKQNSSLWSLLYIYHILISLHIKQFTCKLSYIKRILIYIYLSWTLCYIL